MNPLNIIRGFDPALYDYFETELERQQYSLSFIPDENSISPLCSAMMGNVLINSKRSRSLRPHTLHLEHITADRICELFKAEHANVNTITIEAASRVVFQALMRRGDVVMSLDMRKREHCNSETLAYRFINFGINPESCHLDMDEIEAKVQEAKPRLIIVSPINYPLHIDYERFANIAKSVGALLWCDISQVAGLIASGQLASPVPYADVVTFTAHGALQGPRCSVIICKKAYAGAIDRTCISFGHSGLGSAELAALSARLCEMQMAEYTKYCQSVIENAAYLAKGLQEGGLRIIGDGTESHLVLVDTNNCAFAGMGAVDSLFECGVSVKCCSVQTSDPEVKFEALRFSSMTVTTRGISKEQIYKLGKDIASFLLRPSADSEKKLRETVRSITILLPLFHASWLCEQVKQNLEDANYINLQSFANNLYEYEHSYQRKRLSRFASAVSHSLHGHREHKKSKKAEAEHLEKQN